MVWGVCRRVLRDDHDAEDAFQATFLVLVRRATAVVPRDKVGVWLHGMAHRTALKARADRARRRWRERPMPAIPVPGGTREEPADDRLLELDRELIRLPEKYRVPIVLCELEGMTHQQAAEQLRWPIGTLSGRLSRGRALLAHRLSRREPMPSLGPLEVMFARAMASARVPSSLLASTIEAMTSGAALPASVAGLISPGAAALSKGVIKHMMLTRMKSVAIAAALAFGLFGIAGSVVLIGQDNRGPGRAAPAPVAAQPQEPAARVKVPRRSRGRRPCSRPRPPWPGRVTRPPSVRSIRHSGRGTY